MLSRFLTGTAFFIGKISVSVAALPFFAEFRSGALGLRVVLDVLLIRFCLFLIAAAFPVLLCMAH